MTQIPNRIQPDTPEAEKWALANDNWDKAVQDIADLGAKFSGTGSYSVTIAAGGSYSQPVGVVDERAQYQNGIQIVPRVETFVDTNNDDNYLLGSYPGTSLSSGQQNCQVSIWPSRRKSSGTVATFIVQHHNFDASQHTYYVVVDESYMQTPATGVFR